MKYNEIPQELWEAILKRVAELIDKQFRPANEIILDDVDLQSLLKISRRTALVYRRKKLFPYYRIDNTGISKSASKSKIYYILSEVIEGIKKNGGQHGKK